MGSLVGGVAYCCVTIKHKGEFKIFPLIEALLAGAGLFGAAHLIFCALYPNHLVQLVDKEGKPFHPEGVVVKLDTWKAVEILVGAAAILVVSFIALVRSCRHGAKPKDG